MNCIEEDLNSPGRMNWRTIALEEVPKGGKHPSRVVISVINYLIADFVNFIAFGSL